MANFSQLVETAIAKAVPIGSTPQGTSVNTAFVGAMVNEGYHKVERAALWKFSEAEATLTTTVGSRSVTGQPTDLGIILGLFNDYEEIPLEYLDKRQGFFDPDAEGIITNYTYWADTIEVWPTPTRADSLTLRYYKTWPDLSGTDVPLFPEQYHDLLTSYAAGQLILRLPPTGNRFLPDSKAQPYLAEFREGLASMLASPLTLTVADEIYAHDIHELVYHEKEW